MSILQRVPWQLLWVALALVWGSSFLWMKVALEALHPMQVSTLRVVVAAGTLLLLAVALRQPLPRDGRTWALLAVCSFFLTALPFTAFVVAETRISSGLAAIGNAVTPIATVLFALLLLPSDRPTPRKLTAVGIGFVGVVLVAEPWASEGAPDLVGFLIALAGGVSYGIGWTLNRRRLAGTEVPGLAHPTALMLTGAPMTIAALLVWSAIEGWPPLAPVATEQLLPALGAVAVLGVVGTGVAYILQFEVVRSVGPTISATVTYFIPVVAVGLGFLVLHERLGAWQLIGAAVVIGAGLLIQGRRARKPQAAPAA